MLCPSCARRLQPGPVDLRGLARVVVAFEYEGAARELVLALKLRGLRAAAEPLVAALHRRALESGIVGDRVTWVPARPGDVRVRGYDHAHVLAAGMAARLGLPGTALLTRARTVEDQAGLSAAQRRLNLRDAFRSRPCRGGIVLVDDVVTTGATAQACARALRAAGAARVELVAACRKS